MTHRRRFAASATALALLAATHVLVSEAARADGGGSPAAGQAATTAQVWVTTADGGKRLERGEDVAFDGGRQEIDLAVDASEREQQFTGAGASLTEASARLMAALPEGEREQLMHSLFSTDGEGIGLDYLRQPFGGSDFVAELPYYSYEDEKGSFSVDRDRKEILPLLRQALAVNPGIRVMGSPWSAPAWMKDGGALEGGSLKPENQEAYADYLVKAVEAYADAGVPVHDLTVQNEPLFETTYPSMGMSAAEQAEFLRVLDGKLTAAGLGTELFAYDHNWDKPEYPLEVLAKTGDIGRVQGAAFHCYGGEPEAQQQVRDAGGRVFFTECSGTDSDESANTFADSLKWQTENLVIRSMRSGSETVVLWNMALDENGGPHFGNCGTRCNGVVEIDGGSVTRNAEYYTLGHISRFVDRGAHRIGSTTQQPGGVEDVVFENPDGSRAAVVLNSAGSPRKFSVTEAGRSLAYELPAGAVATFTWPGAPTG
ncbi:glycosyl hydrolase [Streptomyces abyssalis]|uniref:Glycosyl hydrolase n=1 Tax=Streptomyces abyssalis TaxID=933944 RepID=A0A1E7JRW6_9ACTN|nr:glycoside hydrolase family 30 beta sandwich domain-containing protein [Streptomyces abyssalis]OEU91640.1 glycosyl hydrolase [Streptomyces abyssalis]OEU94223.1 glycosyl hydrolase [Streptomyces abyssalis]